MTAAHSIAPRLLVDGEAERIRWLLGGGFEGAIMPSAFGAQLEAVIETKGYRDVGDSWHVVPMRETKSRTSYELAESLLEDADEFRQLLTRWRVLEPRDREALSLLYGEAFPEIPKWGRRGPFVLRSTRALRAWEAYACDRRSPLQLADWLSWLRGRGDAWALLVQELELEADTRMDAACRAWERTYHVGQAARRRAFPSRRRRDTPYGGG